MTINCLQHLHGLQTPAACLSLLASGIWRSLLARLGSAQLLQPLNSGRIVLN